MLLESRRLGLAITETPLVYYPRERGLSTLSRPSIIVRILLEMYRYAVRQVSRATLMDMLGGSPLVKICILLLTAFTSVALAASGVHFDQGTPWIVVGGEAGLASILFNWRTGLVASAIPLLGLETWALWQGSPLWATENYHLLAWGAIGIPLSQIGSGGWRLLQRSLRLTPSE